MPSRDFAPLTDATAMSLMAMNNYLIIEVLSNSRFAPESRPDASSSEPLPISELTELVMQVYL